MRLERLIEKSSFHMAVFIFGSSRGKGNMECLKSLNNGLRTILQYMQVVCKLSFSILISTQQSLNSRIRKRLKEEQTRVLKIKTVTHHLAKSLMSKTKYGDL